MNATRLFAKVVHVLGLFITINAFAGVPVWTFTPLTPTTISVAPGSNANISYIVTNQSNRVHTLFMSPIQALYVVPGPGYCSNPMVLLPKQSCVLNLLVNGSELCFCGPVVGGPVLCEVGSPMECYQPSPLNILNIQLVDLPVG